MVTTDGSGDSMWNAASHHGDLGLMRVPVAQFTPEVTRVSRDAYRGLEPLTSSYGSAYGLHNRFVGDYLVYGNESGDGNQGVQVFDLNNNRSTRLATTHATARIEPIGSDALIVGNNGSDLVFDAIALNSTPELAGEYTIRGASQGESRSHGFFYLPSGSRTGMLGLPITRGPDYGDWRNLSNTSSAVTFLSVDALHFAPLGELRSSRENAADDHCVASCTDWYGNARPIFWHGRTFALLGYELVEGSLSGGRMDALRRVNMLSATQHNGGTNAFDNLVE
jgi:hypothetical protein